MPKQTKKNTSRKNFFNPYFAPSGSRPGVQIQLPSTLSSFSRQSINSRTGNRPGSNPSQPKGSEISGWNAFDKYAGRALLIGTGAHLAYKGGKYIQQRFIASQGRNFAPGQEPAIPRQNVEPPVEGEFLPDEEIEMANLNQPLIQDEAQQGMQGFETEAAQNAVGVENVPEVAQASESWWSKIWSSIKGGAEEAEEELTPLLEDTAEAL